MRKSPKFSWRLALFLLLTGTFTGLFPATAGAVEGSLPITIEYRAALVDDDPVQVLQSQDGWTPVPNGFNIPADTGTAWVRVNPVRPVDDALLDPRNQYRLTMINPSLDKVWFHHFTDGQPVAHYRAGDQFPFGDRPLRHNVPVFPLVWNAATQSTSVLLKIEDPIMPTIDLELLSLKAHRHWERNMTLLVGGYLGILLIMCLYHLAVFIFSRTEIYFYYAMLVFTYFYGFASYCGYFFEFLWPDSLWWQNHGVWMNISLMAIASIGFLRHFLKPYMAYWYKYVAMTFVGLYVINIPVSLMVEPRTALMISGAITAPATLIGMACLLQSIHKTRELLIINLGSMAAIAGAAFNMSIFYGMPSGAELRLTVFMGGALIELAMFSMAMASHLRSLKEQKERIMRSVSGLVSQNVLSSITTNPGLIPKSVAEETVSIMFVDIVGFSRTFDSCPSGEIFASLQEILGFITEIIHEYGGTVDRSMGDGILCFFGYDLAGKRIRGHADQAMSAAIAIQEEGMRRIWQNTKNVPVFPLRIGINTSKVHMGNVGTGDRFDFTIIGKGVNLANRLEAACSPHKIILSPSTKSELRTHYSKGFVSIHVKMKHHQEFYRAWEYNHFRDRPDLLSKADKAFWAFRNFTKTEPRYRLAFPGEYCLTSSWSAFEVINFSESGVSATANMFFGRGAQISVKVKTRSERLENDLRRFYLHQFTLEVCWSRPLGQGLYKHGCKIIGHNPSQKQVLFRLVRQYLEHEPVDDAGRPGSDEEATAVPWSGKSSA